MSQLQPIEYGIAHANDLFGDFIEALKRYNRTFIMLAKRLDAVQEEIWGKNRDGRVILRMTDCGVSCIGCPHPEWKIQALRQNSKPDSLGYGRLFIVEGRTKRPDLCRSVARSAEAVRIVSQINRMRHERKRMIAHAKSLRQSLAQCFPCPTEEVI